MIELAVRITPRARCNAVGGLIEGADGKPLLAIRLAAPPVDGAANKALVAFLAAELNIPKSAIAILSGKTGRIKRVGIADIAADAIRSWIESAAPAVSRATSEARK